MSVSDELPSAVAALSAQIFSLLPQARPGLGEARHADIASRAGQIRQEALRGVNHKTLVEDKAWLDAVLAELLGLVGRKPQDGNAG